MTLTGFRVAKRADPDHAGAWGLWSEERQRWRCHLCDRTRSYRYSGSTARGRTTARAARSGETPMNSKAYADWMKAGMDMWMLGAEAGTVMALRMTRIAAGGSAAAAEAELMVTEKVRAAIELQTRLMTGAFGVTPLGATQGTLKHYRRKVAANNRRLTSKRRKLA